MVVNNTLKNKVFSTIDFSFDGEITVKEGINGTYVKYDGKTAVIGFSTIPQQARCFFLLSMHIKNGEDNFEISESPQFDTIGPMLDLSRGKVMKVEAIKRYIDVIVTLGMNMFMMYTEDMFDLEDYPMFGYLRGRYSLAELKEVDDYAYSLGVEVIPCIQTLGHLGKYMRWSEAAPIKENANVLLVGEEKTYKFIEQEIITMRKAFRSNKIHLGMDEAFGLGLGNYLKKHGLRPESEIFYEHLERVLKISKKYFDSPMIWSDMLFNNPDGIPYYDKFILPQDRVDGAPKDVSLVYWDYYREDFDYYDKLLTQHVRFDNDIYFAGGLWTWDGIVPNFTYTLNTSKPAMEACFKHNIKTFIITLWLSGQAGADFMQAVPGLTVFSEYCYKGENCTDDDIYNASKHISGVDRELYHALSDNYIGLRGARSFGKAVMYGDPLVNLTNLIVDYDEAYNKFANSLEVLKARPNYKYNEFFTAIFRHGLCKLELYKNLKNAYKAGDKAYLEKAANVILPEAIAAFDKMYELFKADWKRDYKIFDIMMYTHDFGGARLRMLDAVETINDYLNGKTDCIEELEAEIISGINKSWQTPKNYISNFE